MKVGFITTLGPGMGHLRRCEALRAALEKRGHDIVSAFDNCDWIVVDDYACDFNIGWSECRILDGPHVIALYDSDLIPLVWNDLVIRPHKTPELAWVRPTLHWRSSLDYVDMGMSQEGRKLYWSLEKTRDFCMRIDRRGMKTWWLAAPGHSSWERCAEGIPTLQIIFSESQVNVAKAIENAGAGVTVWNVLGEGPVDESVLKTRIEAALDPVVLKAMAENARKLCDGKGAERTVKLMEELV